MEGTQFSPAEHQCKPTFEKELNHFSHEEHPLMLTEVQGSEDVVCYGCQRIIIGAAYCCGLCNYFLHKKCAELPLAIQHPMHNCPNTLALFSHSPYDLKYKRSTSSSCNICTINWKWFTYHCSSCNFDIHVSCASEEPLINHKSHQHPLTFLPRPSSFKCDACGTKEEHSSYLCTTCKYWIHSSCASASQTIKSKDHPHRLFLAYSLPVQFRSASQYCGVCKSTVHAARWVYFCANCTYFAHVKCA